MKKIISVVGARPNFMKMAPVHKAFEKHNRSQRSEDGSQNLVQHLICHTGQHYDEKMSKVFFEDLELPKPDFYLGVGSGSHAEQTAKIMIEFEKVLLQEKPDLVIVYGDVNSTVACALTAVKLNIKVAHVEAGLRSFDRTMPEEINRILTDSISDYLFVTEKSGVENLKREGVPEDKIFFVGNTMIDSLVEYLPKVELTKLTVKRIKNVERTCLFGRQGEIPQGGEKLSRQVGIHSGKIEDTPVEEISLFNEKYILVTLHRPSNVDNQDFLKQLVTMFNKLAEEVKIVFPIHPRTLKKIQSCNPTIIQSCNGNVLLTEPIGYLDFIALMKNAKAVISDSGGIQEETTYLGVPCLTIRENTERPITIKIGTNKLLGTDIIKAIEEAGKILNNNGQKGSVPELWDGKASNRIIKILINA